MLPRKPITLLLSSILAMTAAVKAEYYWFNGENDSPIDGSDIIYKETRNSSWTSRSIYNARWFPYIFGQNSWTSFYSGLLWGGHNSTGTINVGYIQSFWAIGNPVNPGDSVTPDWWGPPMTDAPSIGEGASGKVEGSLSMSTGVWYPTLIRLWRPTGNPANVSKCGQWCKDGATGKWIHISTFNIPFVADRFSNEGTFLEWIGGSETAGTRDFRNYYFRNGGSWKPAKNVGTSTNEGSSNVTKSENDTVVSIETLAPDSTSGNLKPDAYFFLVLATPETPSFDGIVVNSVAASHSGDRLLVKWNIPETSAPQFSYKAEVFSGSNTSGTPAKTLTMIDPDTRSCSLDIAGISNPTVRLTITDVFDKVSSPIVVTSAGASLVNATNTSGALTGLNYEYYEGSWTSLPSFPSLSPVQSGATSGGDVGIHRRVDKYAVRYRGHIVVPSDGIWEFWLKSSDGSRLVIDGATVVDSDGLHGAGYEVGGSAALKAGSHPVEIQYFKSDSAATGSREETQLKPIWRGPGIEKSAIPESAWSRVPNAGEPVLTFTAPATGTSAAANSLVTVTVAPAGHPVQSVRIYDEKCCRGELISSTTSGANRVFTGTLPLGTGAQKLKVRLVYGATGQYTLDSGSSAVTVTQPPVSPWTLSAIGSHQFAASSSITSEGTHAIIGDNLNINWQLIKGDTTIVARLKRRPSSALLSQFNGTSHDQFWSGGIIFRQDLASNPGLELGTNFVTLFSHFDTGWGWRLQDSTNVKVAGAFSLEVGAGTPNSKAYNWMKLKREGSIFTAYLSVDGVQWDHAGTRDMSAQGFKEEMYAGVYTFARPSTNPNPNYWQFDSVSLGDQPTPKALPILAARWKMDENEGFPLIDSSGGENHGAILGAATRVASVTGNGVKFDGVSQSAELLAPGLYSNTATLSGWIKRDGSQNGWPTILIARKNVSQGLIFGPSNDLRFMWEAGANASASFGSGLTVPDGVWTFVALTVEPTKATLYMRPQAGEMKTAVCMGTFNPTLFNASVYMASDPLWPNAYFKGVMDEFRVYRRTLSATEVTALSNNQSGFAFVKDPFAKSSARVGTAYAGSIADAAYDLDGSAVTYAKVSGPAWLAVAADGALSGTPAAGDDGKNTFVVSAKTGAGETLTATMTIPVLDTGAPADSDGDGFPDPLENELGTDANSADSAPSSLYADLRGWWKIDEGAGSTTAESTGRTAFAGTLAKTPTWITGHTGNGLRLDGVDQHVSIPALNLNKNTVTITAWVKRNGTQASYAGIAYSRDARSSGLLFGRTNNLIYNWNDKTWAFEPANFVLPDGVWTFCAVVVEPTQATLYMLPEGGTLTTVTRTATHEAAPFSSNFMFGLDALVTHRRLKGDIDEVRVYSRSLTSDEIMQLAGSALPASAQSSSTTAPSAQSSSGEPSASGRSAPAGSSSGSSDSAAPSESGGASYAEIIATTAGAKAATLLLMTTDNLERADAQIAWLKTHIPELADQITASRDTVFGIPTGERLARAEEAAAKLTGIPDSEANALLSDLATLETDDGISSDYEKSLYELIDAKIGSH